MLVFAVEGDGGGCLPPSVSPRCMLMFTVGGGWWWVMLPRSVALLFRVLVAVAAGGSTRHQARVVEQGMLIVVCRGS